MTLISLLHGRLGNVLFQIATNKYYAKQHNLESKFFFSLAPCHINDRKDFYSNKLDKLFNLDMVDVNYIQNFSNNSVLCQEIGAIDYTPINILPNHNALITGNRQSPLYFTKEFVIDLFKPDNNIIKALELKYGKLSEYNCLHVRRGDYISERNAGNKIFKLFDADRLNKLLNRIGGKFIVISDDIHWCKENIKYEQVIFANGSIFEDFWLQTQCKNNVISNSTFSWWGAYLNQTENRKVYYDSPWFNGVGDGDIIPKNDNWIDINQYV